VLLQDGGYAPHQQLLQDAVAPLFEGDGDPFTFSSLEGLPRQTSPADCGLFVLMYAQSICECIAANHPLEHAVRHMRFGQRDMPALRVRLASAIARGSLIASSPAAAD
jgi:hypothetical protein